MRLSQFAAFIRPKCRPSLSRSLAFAALAALPALAIAQEATPTLNAGDTAWMLMSTALVLLMTIPGLALFYGGLVRSKNVLSVLMQCFAITAVITLLWTAYGYSIAFDTTGMIANETNLRSFVGSLEKAFFAGMTRDSLVLSIPESVFATFQMTFAIITPALIVGAFAERMRFGALLAFVVIWFSFSYLPIAHMVWSGAGGYFFDRGVIDFAGGTVVHINAGVAGLVACLMIGKRRGYPNTAMPPHNLTYTLIGASLLWFGWFGFNAGSAVAANGAAGMAMLTTQIATAAATLAWMAAEWLLHKKPSVLGAATGAVAGLVAITPASGSCGPVGAIVIGFVSGIVCFYSATALKRKFGYDDALDVFGVHGVGGIVGALLTGVFAASNFGGVGLVADVTISAQLWKQSYSILVTVGLSAIVSFLALKLIGLFGPIRVNDEEESVGLDISLHNERGYSL
jgi:ammonium transporter, Amt family